MGLTKQYLRYGAAGVFNIVGGARSNVALLELRGAAGRYCAVGACENVIVWDTRKGEKMFTLKGDRHEVTCLAACPRGRHLAVGYSNGTVRVYDVYSGESNLTFSGHKSAVTALNYDAAGMRLVSGSKDTEVVVWDIVNESGLYRLRSHKGMITQARFMHSRNVLVTSSKDTFIKFWDLDTQHCFRTLVGHRTEVWDFVLGKNDSRLITGSADMELRVWELLSHRQDSEGEPERKRLCLETKEDPLRAIEDEDEEEEEGEEEQLLLTCKRLGSLSRQGKDRVVSLALDNTGTILACHGSDSLLEVFRIHTDDEMRKSLHKRQKKARKRAREGETEVADVTLSVDDEICRITVVKMAAKLRSFCCHLEKNNAKVIGLLTNNSLQTCELDVSVKKCEAESVTKLTIPGHRTDVRTLCFSSDNTALLSASADSLKIWNRSSLQCIRSMKCGYALCCMFVPGDRHAVIGTKSGHLELYDIAAGVLLESINAHTDAVWSACLAPHKKGLVSGAADKEVKFWDFELVTDEDYSATSKRLSLVHTRTLKMTESILCLKYSPDSKFLAVSLLDATVKVFFADTLKFFLSLYGHKLPVLCMDISTDSTLIVTGAADRNVKIWGLDFGDCHKSIFAHDDSVMCVQFVPKTHMFFTGGKDAKIKEWNADNFDHIITLDGHHFEVWSLAISPSGNFVASASHDKSIRLWERTQEPLVLEEEREMEREREFEESIGGDGQTVVAGETGTETGLAGKKTAETVKAAERLMEAVDLYQEESAKIAEHEAEIRDSTKRVALPVHPLFAAYGAATPKKYVLEVLKKIKSSELEEALLVLPFSYVSQMLEILHTFLDSSWEIELSCRCLFFLLRVHQGEVTTSPSLLSVLDHLRATTTQNVAHIRDTVGFNLAGLNHLKQLLEAKQDVQLFADATDRFKQKKKKNKKKAILTIKT